VEKERGGKKKNGALREKSGDRVVEELYLTDLPEGKGRGMDW